MNLAMKGFLLLTLVVACKGEPKTSYCEALCDWAVGCASGERDVDSDALTQSCLDATRSGDASCAKAEAGTIDPASGKLLEGCTTDIQASADSGSCDGFTGTFVQLKAGVPPVSCATQAGDYLSTYNDARSSTTETNEELCNRVTDTLCQKASDCILGDFAGDIPKAATDKLGTPYDNCVGRLDPVVTQKCITNGLYEPESGLTDANLARQGARECMSNFDTLSCSDLIATPPAKDNASCAAMFSSADDLANVGKALVGMSDDFAKYIPK